MPSPADVEKAARRRTKMLTSIATWISSVGYPPSVSELATEHEVSALTVRRDLAALEGQGKIERDPRVARGIRLKV